MIGYVTLGTNDLPRAKAFYDTLLAEIGVKRLMEFGDRGYAWAAAMDKPMLCIMKPYDGRPATVGNGVMAGIAVDSRDQVDRVHRKALELGGTDEGPPACAPRAATASTPPTSATSTATSSTCSATAEAVRRRPPAGPPIVSWGRSAGR